MSRIKSPIRPNNQTQSRSLRGHVHVQRITPSLPSGSRFRWTGTITGAGTSAFRRLLTRAFRIRSRQNLCRTRRTRRGSLSLSILLLSQLPPQLITKARHRFSPQTCTPAHPDTSTCACAPDAHARFQAWGCGHTASASASASVRRHAVRASSSARWT